MTTKGPINPIRLSSLGQAYVISHPTVPPPPPPNENAVQNVFHAGKLKQE